MNILKELGAFIVILIMSLIGSFLFMWVGTSKEYWYVDKHDSQCEMNNYCHCYERFIQSDKN